MKGIEEQSKQVALALLRIKAVSIAAAHEPFVFASGLRSPMYCDNRITLAYPHIRDTITDAFAHYATHQAVTPDVVVGVATAGIAHAAWLAQRLGLPMAYVRSKTKGYGRQRRIEGRLEPGQHSVVVEDLVTTGSSSLEAVEAVYQTTGRTPEAVYCIFTYNHPGVRQKFAAAQSPLIAICDLDLLLTVAQAATLLSGPELKTVRHFQQDPLGWSHRYITSGR